MNVYRALVLASLACLATLGHADDWGGIAVISSTMGTNAQRLCIGEGLRVTDIGCPTYAPYVSTSGYVGIGTNNPIEPLTIQGASAVIRLQDDDDPASSYTVLDDAGANQFKISKYSATGANQLDLNPVPSDGSSAALIRFFRETSTTGGKVLRMHKGDGTSTVDVSIGVDGQPTFFNGGGKVGIGTASPVANLGVSGTISASSIIQVGTGGPACASSISGSMRYSTVSSTMEYCNGSAWTSLGPSGTVVPAFHVHRNGVDQTITTGSVTLVVWTHEDFDTNNNFASNRFTPTIPGYYLVTLSVGCGNVSNCQAQIFKNGSLAKRTIYAPQNSENDFVVTVPATSIFYMNGTTDYLEGWVFSFATPLRGESASTFFTGALLPLYSGSGGGGGADNLGNHTATQALEMAGNNINNAGIVSATLVQVNGASGVETCTSTNYGMFRRNPTTGAIQICVSR